MNDDESFVAILPIGELRALGYNLPTAAQQAPDDHTLGLSVSAARELVEKILASWNMEESDIAALLSDADTDFLSDILAIKALLSVLFSNPENPAIWINSAGKFVEGRSPIAWILEAHPGPVKRHLSYQVYGGGW